MLMCCKCVSCVLCNDCFCSISYVDLLFCFFFFMYLFLCDIICMIVEVMFVGLFECDGVVVWMVVVFGEV